MKLELLPRGVCVLTLEETKSAKGDFENRFTLSLVREANRLLDEVLARPDSRSVVLTGTGKFFSNGHDIAWLERAMDGGEAHQFIDEFYQLLARFMTLGLPTVAAVNGHAFAGGCLLAMAQDYRVMTSGKGFLCMNEIDMVPVVAPQTESKIKPGAFAGADDKMTAVLQSKIGSPGLLRNMYLQGTRFDGRSALAHGLVDAVSDNVLQDAVELAAKLGEKAHFRNRQTVSVLKLASYSQHVQVLVTRSKL